MEKIKNDFHKIFLFVGGFFFAFFLFFITAYSAQAATIYANSSTGNDSTGDGSSGSPYKTFHKVYTESSSGDTIDLAGTFDWSSADETGDATISGYTISKNLTIQGQSASNTIVQADSTPYTGDRRVFTLANGSTLTFQDLTIRHGYLSSGNTSATGIYAYGSNISMIRMIVTLNRSAGTYTSGGETIEHGSDSYYFIMRDSLVSENGNIDGYNNYTGGIYLGGENSANEITNTTFYHNGGAYNGAVYVRGGVSITNCTFIGNRGAVSGTDVHSFGSGAHVYVKNNIFADRYGSGAAHIVAQSGGIITDGGYNIVETQDGTSFSDGVNGNIVGDQASLNIDTSLATNGSSNGVPSLALLADSIAINAGDDSSYGPGSITPPSSDMRGKYRNGLIDIGAFEYDGADSISEPTTQATGVTFSSVAYGTASLSWTNGNGGLRVVFVKQANSGTATPVDQTTYTANTAFGSGTQIGTSGWYCVYRGTGTSVSLTGLVPSTNYIAQVFEFNGTSGAENYFTDSASNNPKTDSTLAASEPSTQAHSASFSSVDYNTSTVSWTRGSGENVAVFMKQANSGTATPVDQTTYTANTAFGSGTQIGTSGWYCIYNGSGTTVGVTGLSAETEYIVQIFEYNASGGYENYFTDSAGNNPKSQSTLMVDAPTTQAHSISFSSVNYTQMTASWTNGNGSKRLVFAKEGNSGTAIPVDDTGYTANTAFGSGTQIGTSGWYCVYNGTGTSVSVTGLSVGTSYVFQVFEYNENGSIKTYFTDNASSNPASQATSTVSTPSSQASGLSLSSVSFSQMTLSWTRGDGDNVAIFTREASSGTTAPVDQTTYTANTAFGSGTQIGTSGWYCVYNGTGTSVTVTGLSAETSYIFQVFEYAGPAGSEDYLTDTATNNPKTQISSSMPDGEAFETNDFSSYGWVFGGNEDWITTSSDKNGGTYSARSGVITHSQSSSMEVTLNVQAGDISYYRKVSSESCCDFLRFYIDDVQKDSIAGSTSWEQKTYSVTEGEHTFKWDYSKDGSVSTGLDAGFVDDILFPDLVDTTAPTITSVSSGKTNGSYNAGDVIDIDLIFSEAVSSTGDITVTLETGDTDRTCSFSVSNSSTGTCNYTVQEGDGSADLTVSSISGTIADASDNAMTNFSPTSNLADNKAIVIDTTDPENPVANPGAGTYTSIQSVSLSSSGSSAIYYTINGDTPTTSSTEYSSAISVASSQTLKVLAVDLAGNESSILEADYVINLDSSDPVISNVSASASSDSATITWTTNEESSSQVEYGLVSGYGSQTSEVDNSSRITSHSVALSNLKSCATYYYRVKSTDAGSNQAVSAQKTLYTSGCEVSTISNGNGNGVNVSGGTVSLNTDDGTASIQAPENFYSESATMQINKLLTSSAPTAPTGSAMVSDNFFELRAILGDGSVLSTFDQSVTFTVSYGSDIEETYNESTLDVYKYSGGSWVAKSCTVDTSANTITCTLPSFSTYGVFGEELEDDDESEEEVVEDADVDSWKAYLYDKPGTSCSTRLRLEIKGDDFDNDARVKIGGKKAYNVEVKKGDEKIIARFCMEDLLKVKTSLKRSVSVTNPDADKEKAKKKINLAEVTYKFESKDFALSNPSRTLNIQKALISLGFLDAQYSTGYYGMITSDAVKSFQAKNGIAQTGTFGPITETKLIKELD